MSEETRKLELEVEVVGTPEEVWEAIATGPGITSWYVPHQVEERAGGAASARFGPGPEMEVPGRVAEWDPPNRIVFDGGEGVDGMAFEWTIEAKDGGSCVVRLVNTGFGAGEEWDAQYDAMGEGWRMFLFNLQLHRRHFAGRHAQASLPTAGTDGDAQELWVRMLGGLGVVTMPAVGERVVLAASTDLTVAGEVVDVATTRLSLLVDEPAPGTAFVAAEQVGPQVSLSVWSYLYDDDGAEAVARDEPRWAGWLQGLVES